MGEQLPSLHLAVPGMGLGQRKRSETGQSSSCKDVPSWASLWECLGLVKGHREIGLECSRGFIRSLEQQGSQGCRRSLIFFIWKMGFT